MIVVFTQADHDDLTLAVDLMDWASEIINGVLDRHPHDLTMQMVSFLCGAKRDADLGAREAGMADRYMDWKGGKSA